MEPPRRLVEQSREACRVCWKASLHPARLQVMQASPIARPSVIPRAIKSAPENGRRGSSVSCRNFRARSHSSSCPGRASACANMIASPAAWRPWRKSKPRNPSGFGGSLSPCSPLSASAAPSRRSASALERRSRSRKRAASSGSLTQSAARRRSGSCGGTIAATRRSRAGFGADAISG